MKRGLPAVLAALVLTGCASYTVDGTAELPADVLKARNAVFQECQMIGPMENDRGEVLALWQCRGYPPRMVDVTTGKAYDSNDRTEK